MESLVATDALIDVCLVDLLAIDDVIVLLPALSHSKHLM